MKARATLLTALIGLSALTIACHKHAETRMPARTDVVVPPPPVIRDTVRIVAPTTDPTVVAIFKDTGVVNVLGREGRFFPLRTPAERASLRAALKKERALWQARKPSSYRFLLRVGCFCPGVRGWLLMDVRSGQPLRAWDRTGRAVALTDWNTLSIDGLFDSLEKTTDTNGEARIAFDPRWHFPIYVSISALPGPDMWSLIEARALRPN